MQKVYITTVPNDGRALDRRRFLNFVAARVAAAM
jgi:hypothetical protein